jgi:hypothetical protein
MSLIVGRCLGAAAIIGALSSNVLGMAATNAWTEIAWGIAAAVLLLNVLIPRRTTMVAPDGRRSRHWGQFRDVAPAAAVGAARAPEREHERNRERGRGCAATDRPAADRPVHDDRPPARDTAARERMVDQRRAALE